MITSPYGHELIQSPDFHEQNYDDPYENIFVLTKPNITELSQTNGNNMQNKEHLNSMDEQNTCK